LWLQVSCEKSLFFSGELLQSRRHIETCHGISTAQFGEPPRSKYW
jgi:hypothetical protein